MNITIITGVSSGLGQEFIKYLDNEKNCRKACASRQ